VVKVRFLFKCKIVVILGLWLVTSVVVFSLPESKKNTLKSKNYKIFIPNKSALYTVASKQTL